jgi:hypothetical protein
VVYRVRLIPIRSLDKYRLLAAEHNIDAGWKAFDDVPTQKRGRLWASGGLYLANVTQTSCEKRLLGSSHTESS